MSGNSIEGATSSRRYAGQTREFRVAERHRRLIQAAITVAGRGGKEALTVMNVCAEAGLTTRFFYESFVDRDQLFAATFTAVSDRLLAYIDQAPSDERGDRAMRRLFEAMRSEPVEARVFLLDLDSQQPLLRPIAQRVVTALGEALAPEVLDPLARTALVGAILAMAKLWIRTGFEQPTEGLVEVAFRVRRSVGDPVKHAP